MEYWTAAKQEDGRWLFTWTSASDESWDVWLNGRKLDTVEGGEYTYNQSGYVGHPPPLEIVAEGADAENSLYPPFVYLQWREEADEAGYLIEKYTEGEWVTTGTLPNSKKGYHAFRTQPLEDDTDIPFRIFALNFRGEQGDAIEFTAHVVRNPARPSVDYEINSVGDLVVGEA